MKDFFKLNFLFFFLKKRLKYPIYIELHVGKEKDTEFILLWTSISSSIF